jgi:poly [ADP-ribose] polymerase
MAYKSLNYCCPVDNTALILLCEVSVGKPNVVKNSDCSFCKEKLPKGTHSTKYLGGCYPPENSYVLHNGVYIPLGKPSGKNTYDFNEYIVYDVAQVKMKYLLKLKY